MLRVARIVRTLVIGSVAALGACAADPDPADPGGAFANPDSTVRERERSVRAIAERGRAEGGDPEATRQSLKSIAWRRSEQPVVRTAAIEELALDDPQDTMLMLNLMLPTETQWTVIRLISELAVDNHWTELTPGFVRSWSRPVDQPTDDQRPEREALAGLHPGVPVEDTVFSVFAKPTGSELFRDRTRREAWALLCRIDEDGSRTRDLLASPAFASTDDELINLLRRGARELAVVPRTGPQLEWLTRLDEEAPEFWAASAERVAALNAEQRAGLEIRHLPAIAWAEAHQPDWLDRTRAELLGLANERLDGRRRYRRSQGYADRMAAPKETIEEWVDRLVWADALNLLVADNAVRDPDVIDVISETTQTDRRDRTTEYGGVIDSAPDSSASAQPAFRAVVYPPRPTQRGGDQRFIAPAQMLRESNTALLHFHLQVQRADNSEYAGPSAGDFEYAREQGRSCVVFTSVGSTRMNVDYYQPDGAKIDLGVIEISR